MARHVAGSHDEANEARPLLSPIPDSHSSADGLSTSEQLTHCDWPWIRVVALVVVIAVVSDIGESLYAAPRVRFFESIVCTEYYRQEDPSLLHKHGDIPEHLCKVNPVQDELASVLGWQLFFDSIPAILLPVPYGYLADRRGRKQILIMAMVGYTMSYVWTLFSAGVLHLPLNYVWLSSLFFLLGGGPTVGTTLLTTVVADVVPPESRTTVFFYRFCTDLIADVAIPPLTSFLMSKNIWIPLFGAVLFQAGSSVMTFTLPETLPLPIPKEAVDHSTSPSIATTTSEPEDSSNIDKRWKDWIRETKDSFDFVRRDTAVAALVLTLLISKVGRQSTNVLFQYASKRYGWSLSQAGLLISLRAAVNIALFAAILPAIASFALRRIGAAPLRDLLLARGSIIFLLLGTIVLFLSATPALMIIGIILFTLGTGFAPTARSLVTSLVESQCIETTSDIGRLYALISVMEGVGALVAALGMSWALRFGLHLGQAWLGLPFGFAAILFAVVAIITFSIKVRSV
ncbi:hypothetical protein AYL99_01782 [Fonsecaea erecta]|uniref:Major facilitator superfamily (MFS) profile domain-containing protein n=1 Tax=Fonsecaea erecta TaxID=1367422 RepID=A0A178ZU09_9EURO|nr:hypothetical protein AYL99_01782 [Fonsecaea erecta]OAP62555.1 hypothetical protein AYL99_01782 [Fonsecaea erecta]